MSRYINIGVVFGANSFMTLSSKSILRFSMSCISLWAADAVSEMCDKEFAACLGSVTLQWGKFYVPRKLLDPTSASVSSICRLAWWCHVRQTELSQYSVF
jgi:hypothetical protein